MAPEQGAKRLEESILSIRASCMALYRPEEQDQEKTVILAATLPQLQ